MKFKYYILIVIIAICSQNIQAQNNSEIDSLLEILDKPSHDTTKINILTELSFILSRTLPDSAAIFAEKGIELAKINNHKLGEANLYKNLGEIDWGRGNLDLAEESFNKALVIYIKLSESTDKNEKLKSKTGIGFCYNGIGTVWFLRGDYSKALKYFQLSLTNHENINYLPGIAKGYNNIGLVHWKQINYDRALEYFQRALDIFNELEHSRDMGGCFNNMAIIYKKQGKYSEALKYYNKSLDILYKLDDKKGIALCFNNMGMLYEKINKLDLALDYYQKALELKILVDDRQGISSSYSNLASVNNKIAEQINNSAEKIKKYKQAIKYAHLGLSIANSVGALYQEMESYEILSISYEGLGQFDKSLKCFKSKTELKDSLFNQSKNKQIEEAEAKFQTAQKQQEIDKQNTKLEKQKTYRNFLIIFSVLIIILIILLYSRSIFKQRTNKILEEKNKELQKLSIVASETDNAVTICDAEGNFEWVNESLFRLFGYTLEERKKIHESNVVKASSNPNIKDILSKVKETKKSTVYESLVETRSGEIKNLQTTLTPFLDKKGEIQKLIFVDTDISKLKNAEKEILQKNEEIQSQKDELEKHRNKLEQEVDQRTKDLNISKEKAEESDRLKSSFLTNMSHEIRTPMNAIIGFSSMLGEDDLETEIKNNLISEISTHGYSLLNLIDNILELARIDTNQLKIQKEKVELVNIMQNVHNSFYDLVELKGLNLNLQIPKNKVEVYSDGYRIKQIFNNLIDNAIKYTEIGNVDIGYTITRNTVEFFVKDTGIGLSLNQQTHIFYRFTKVEDNKKKLYRGAGLGLAICHNIVSLLNGNIWVESEPEKGSSFYFTIPAHIKDNGFAIDTEKKTVIDSDFDWSDKTILIAEDEESNYRYLEMLLKNTKVKIVWVENGKEAIEKSKENDYDLILMDVKMPILDGLEATQIIKSNNSKIPIVSVSAFSSKEDVNLSIKAGCEEHLSKPIQKTTLLRTIIKYIN
jgi:PAS domain S-box-containing protein